MNKLRKLVRNIFVSYYLSQLRKDQWKSSRQLRKIQFKKLKTIIEYAYNYVPYYHRLFSSANIKPQEIRDHGDLKKIPLTSKRDLQKNYHSVIARGLDISKFQSHITSGSTGIPLKIYFDHYKTGFSSATEKYPFFECGVKLNDNFVTIWGRGVESIVWGRKYVRLWGDISNTVVPLLPSEILVKVLSQISPDVLHTFPSVLSTLANHDVSGISPRLIFTQGEIVTQHCRDLTQKIFNAELFETYGSVEFGNLAFECSEHCGLHMITNGAYIEFIDDNGESVSSEEGEIIVTGLYGHAMPLIRYRIGDVGVPTDEKCSCGRSWPLVKSIQGRVNDFLILPSGRKISWLYLLRLILYDKEFQKGILSILQYQLVQEQKNRIIFKVAKGQRFNPKMLEGIKNNIETHFAKRGENLEVVIQIVKEIPEARTGKKRLFISMLRTNS